MTNEAVETPKSTREDLSKKAIEILYGKENPDVDRGLEMLKESGDLLELGMLYWAGEAVPKDLQKAADIFREGSQSGCANCAFALALFYHPDYGMGTDPEHAFEMMSKAMEMGSLAALEEIGRHYEKGLGVEQSYEKAFEKYMAFAERAMTPDMSRTIARFYREGLGVEKSQEKADYYESMMNPGG